MSPTNNNLKYPSRFEIEQVLKSSFCSRSFVNKFAQSKGIFVVRASQDDLASHLARFFYENREIEAIRDRAYRRTVIKSLSGFIISSQDDNFDPINTIEELRGGNTLTNGIQLSAITKEILDSGVEQYKGEMEYVEQKAGRTEFLQEEHRHLEYVIKPIDETSYQVLVESNKSSDSKFFESFVKRKAGKDIRLETLDSDLMSAINTINFLDDLGVSGMESDWRLRQVKHLVLRRGEEEEEETDKTVLSGIAQAILNGYNLRENPFVKDAESNGYKFTAMTYEYENIKKGYTIEVIAEFKLRPKVFEVGVHNFKKRVGLDEKLEKADLSSTDEIQIKTYFWLRAKEIYKNLVSSTST